MKKGISVSYCTMFGKCLLFSLVAVLLLSCSRDRQTLCVDQPFDAGWLFHRGDIEGGENPSLSDTGWRKLDIPHDWSIEDIPGTNSPFDSTVVNGVSSGFTRCGIGWYRKHFSVASEAENEKVILRFDGVYMNSDVWVNGYHAGNHFYGYSPFEYDISPWINFSGDNVIAVRVNNDSVRCRWYSGSGIYRHVALKITSRLNVDQGGIAVTTPEVSKEQATVVVNTILLNEGSEDKKATLYLQVIDNKGNKIVTRVEDYEIRAGQRATVEQSFSVSLPHLWSLEDPCLYTVEAAVMVDHTLADQVRQSFGIRTIQFDAETGFRLNGKEIELQGGCIHHDNGPLGAVALDRAEERRVELLKAAGFNAIRMAHNPPSAAMLDACDRLGMLVIDEAFDVWRYGHFPGDYSLHFDSLWREDLRSMVLRDRNHPCIIMWSIGNEIRNTDTEEIAEVCRELADFVRSLDPTRPVTVAVNAITPLKDPFFSHLDVCGYNYCRGLYLSDHERLPARVMFCSESYPSEAYDYWKDAKEYPWVTGDFVWTALDHIGEASIGWRGYPQDPDFFPWNLAWCGDLDICGFPRPQSFYRQTLWKEEPMVALFVTPPIPSFPLNPAKEWWSVWDWPDVTDSWNFKGYENDSLKVSVYSRC
ncbi:MAG: glycoside hydrolase family 2 TIM barrel-domain containing protein, partial [Bacteroidales bacterium]|nr:glycoside hydrolase family 2 TIM barrel-domain containing protein [Bacteroidales bacterium]